MTGLDSRFESEVGWCVVYGCVVVDVGEGEGVQCEVSVVCGTQSRDDIRLTAALFPEETGPARPGERGVINKKSLELIDHTCSTLACKYTAYHRQSPGAS